MEWSCGLLMAGWYYGTSLCWGGSWIRWGAAVSWIPRSDAQRSDFSAWLGPTSNYANRRTMKIIWAGVRYKIGTLQAKTSQFFCCGRPISSHPNQIQSGWPSNRSKLAHPETFQLRTSMAQFFWLTESNPRELKLAYPTMQISFMFLDCG